MVPTILNQKPVATSALNRCFTVLSLLIVFLEGCQPSISAIAASHDQNWPAWRGPLSTGVAPNAIPPTVWDETNNIKWKVTIPGSGASTPIIWDQRVFLQTTIPSKRDEENDLHQEVEFVILCLDRQNGHTMWQKIARKEVPHEGHHADHGFASYSPVTDGRHVFAWFGSRGLHCYDVQGNLKWEKDFGRMHTKSEFGEGGSPALFQRALILNWDHEGDDFIVALDTESGNELWRHARSEETSWATPLIVQHDGKVQVVTAAQKKIRSYDLVTGNEIWNCAGLTQNVVPSPVAGFGKVYATSGAGGSAFLAIQLGSKGDLTGTDAILWTHNKSTPYVSSPLLYQNRLYFFSGLQGILSCLDADSGQPIIDAERVEGYKKFETLKNPYASPVGANGQIYLVGRNGVTVVLKQSDKLEVIAANKLNEDFIASPALVGRELYLRGQMYLYCVADK